MMPLSVTGETPRLVVDDLRITFRTPQRVIEAVRGVSFAVGREKVGIVGESGSGKSMTGRAILRLTPPRADVSAKRLSFGDTDLLASTERQMLKVRGRRIAMIMQDPRHALDPVMRVGEQIAEAIPAERRGRAAVTATGYWRCLKRCISAIPGTYMACIRTRSPVAWGSVS